MAEGKRRVERPFCGATATVDHRVGKSVYRDASRTRKDADHVPEECAMCNGHFYVLYSLS